MRGVREGLTGPEVLCAARMFVDEMELQVYRPFGLAEGDHNALESGCDAVGHEDQECDEC